MMNNSGQAINRLLPDRHKFSFCLNYRRWTRLCYSSWLYAIFIENLILFSESVLYIHQNTFFFKKKRNQQFLDYWGSIFPLRTWERSHIIQFCCKYLTYTSYSIIGIFNGKGKGFQILTESSICVCIICSVNGNAWYETSVYIQIQSIPILSAIVERYCIFNLILPIF